MIAPAVVAIASQFVGSPVQISCERNQRFTDAREAYTNWTSYDDVVTFAPVIHLAAKTCNALNRLVVRDGRPHVPHQQLLTNGGKIVDLDDGSAVHLLTHEALHIREEERNESRVECDTLLNGWSMLRLFGLAAWRDRQILRGMRVAHYESATTPVDYLEVC